MKSIFIFLIILMQGCSSYSKKDGLIRKSTQKSVSEVLKMSKKIFKSKGITLFKVIEHHAGAQKVGMKLPPTVTVIFGNPKLGTPLMQKNQSVAIDLPQKLLIFRKNNETILMYNHPYYVSKRHHLGKLPELDKIAKALDAITTKLTRK